MDRLISKMVILEYNISEQNKYRDLIISTKNKIEKNKSEKEKIVQTLKEINNSLP